MQRAFSFQASVAGLAFQASSRAAFMSFKKSTLDTPLPRAIAAAHMMQAAIASSSSMSAMRTSVSINRPVILMRSSVMLLLPLHSKPLGAYAAVKAETAHVAVFGIKLSDNAGCRSNDSHLAI